MFSEYVNEVSVLILSYYCSPSKPLTFIEHIYFIVGFEVHFRRISDHMKRKFMYMKHNFYNIQISALIR